MKRGPLILTLVAGTLVFLCVLVLYLPASWFASWLPPQVRCAELGGSVWQGECVGLTVQDAKLGDATWNLSPLKAITGRLSGDLDVRGSPLTARSDLDLRFDGSGELRDLNAQFPMDPAFIAQFPRGQRGLVAARFARLELGANGAPLALQGTVELRDFRQVSPKPLVLGSYEVTFDGGPVGKLRDLGGPFAVEGTVTFTPPNNYVVQGLISGRTPEAADIVRQDIAFGAPPDASGRNQFQFENSF
jgi:hypothetical protein